MCARTVYCTNIDKKVFWVYNFTFLMDINEENIYDLYVCMKQITQADVKLFFESLCGEVCSCSCNKSDVLFLLKILTLCYGFSSLT